jgi:hypothetical protein
VACGDPGPGVPAVRGGGHRLSRPRARAHAAGVLLMLFLKCQITLGEHTAGCSIMLRNAMHVRYEADAKVSGVMGLIL